MELFSVGAFQDGPVLARRQRHADVRGTFEMAFEFSEIRERMPQFPEIQQINVLHGVQGSIRGFHWSPESANHWKIITSISGKVRDSVLDVRIQSKTYGVAVYLDLDSHTLTSMIIPPGFAHAMQTLSSESVTVYGTNVAYKQNYEDAISPVEMGLDRLWLEPRILSARDLNAEPFQGKPAILKIDPNKGRIN
jgi:dTDP-4-dehydrorhamnose 3,5-epimerase